MPSCAEPGVQPADSLWRLVVQATKLPTGASILHPLAGTKRRLCSALSTRHYAAIHRRISLSVSGDMRLMPTIHSPYNKVNVKKYVLSLLYNQEAAR
jgi:hypothetical protein